MSKKITKSKEKAIEFARKYLADRRDQYVTPKMNNADTIGFVAMLERAWDCAVEYVLLDIIPYIYGEVLD